MKRRLVSLLSHFSSEENISLNSKIINYTKRKTDFLRLFTHGLMGYVIYYMCGFTYVTIKPIECMSLTKSITV